MAIQKSKEEKKGSEEKAVTKEIAGKEEMIPMSQVKDLISQSIKEYADANSQTQLITALTQALQANGGGNSRIEEKFDDLQYLSKQEIAKDDVLKEPVMFWGLGILIVVGDDKKNGRPVQAPYGTIVFKPQGEKRYQRGKETDIQILCTYESWSTIEVEWLRNHTLFGSTFSEKDDKGIDMNQDLRFAQKVSSFAAALRSTHASQILAQAKSMGLPMSMDIDQLRIAIAQARANEDIEKWNDAQRITLQDNHKNKLLKETGAVK